MAPSALGFKVARTGYFFYCNGKTDRDEFGGRIEFDTVLLPYEGNDGWVDGTLIKLKKCLDGEKIPKMRGDCEFCGYAEARSALK